jgi:hypothetical protein
LVTPNPLFDTTTLSEYTAAGGESDSPKNQRIRDQLVHRNVKLCCSGLIHTLIKCSEPNALDVLDINFEDLISVSSQPDYLQAVEEWIEDDASIDDLVEAELIEKPKDDEDDVQIENAEDTLRKVAARNARKLTAAQLRNLYEDQEILCTSNTDEVEALEHWIVDSGFGRYLAEFGEMVSSDIFPDGWTVWGRTTSGQAISMDYVIAQIAASMQILEGQKYSWAE